MDIIDSQIIYYIIIIIKCAFWPFHDVIVDRINEVFSLIKTAIIYIYIYSICITYIDKVLVDIIIIISHLVYNSAYFQDLNSKRNSPIFIYIFFFH